MYAKLLLSNIYLAPMNKKTRKILAEQISNINDSFKEFSNSWFEIVFGEEDLIFKYTNGWKSSSEDNLHKYVYSAATKIIAESKSRNFGDTIGDRYGNLNYNAVLENTTKLLAEALTDKIIS